MPTSERATRRGRERLRGRAGWLARVLVLTAALALVAAAAPAAALARAGTIGFGSRGAAVRQLQKRLIDLRYLRHGAVDGMFGEETWHAVVAFQGWEEIHRDGVVGRVTRRVLGAAKPPRPWASSRRALEVDLARQVLLVVRDGKLERALHASTGGPRHATPRGRFSVTRRERESWSVPYRVWLPFALYFYRGWAIHGFPRVPDRPASHGCIRLTERDARFLYRATPLGTPVVIRGVPSPDPEPPARRRALVLRERGPRRP